jgi:hypothetical protein
VEYNAVVVALAYEADEVVNCVWSNLRVKLSFHNVAVCHFNGNDWVCVCHV